MSFLPSFLSSIVYHSISMVCNLRTFNSHSFNRSRFRNINHSNTILFMNCIQSVIMPMNHSCFTTVYQSFCTTIENEGIHNKLLFFLHIWLFQWQLSTVFLMLLRIIHLHENGNNRIKHCVKPMK